MTKGLELFWNGYVGIEVYPLDNPKKKGEIVVGIRQRQTYGLQKIREDQEKMAKKLLSKR